MYVALGLVAGLALWLFYRFVLERRSRRQPYVAPAEADWARHEPTPGPLRHRLALVGDLGAVATDGQDPVLNLLQHWLGEAGPASSVVILGDNVYPTGIPALAHPGRAAAEKRLDVQLDAFRQYAGRVIFLSGNHDWNKGRPDGYQYLLRQEAYVHEHLPAAHYLPAQGCPGPVTLQLAEGVLLVVLNTQWWVQNGPRPLGPEFGCTVSNSKEPFAQLQHILAQNRHQQIVVAGHHPLYSNAMHGGKFTTKQHLFPLTAAHKKAYVPLPVIGSLFPAYRKLIGAAEDMAHPRYRKMRRRLLRVLHQFPNIIYAAGHDHNLQYFHYRQGHYLVSGSGSKTAFVQPGGKATFTHEHKGFFTLEFYQSGEVWLRTYEPGPGADTPRAAEVFRKKLLPVAATAATLAAAAPAGSGAAS
ncbi:metallophosphoesterase [Hymenobacter chitinivorans]|uniref:Calcineurin-like phosphoesterase family protein n=1 Tax=Hymenobacter chitinivorans DSM 11115 TaxID=1121954 RepID=A0A2M9BQV2_9BACT|nr:metallophosphoesterase [Hymenobacter chitinivorans]PJJ60331.1 calcineurin-like phosphoesterase family protein [Hymenobacter chitinivorans DSM 11115]